MDDDLRPNLDIRTFSNDLGKHFVQKIDTIRTQLDTNQQSDSYPEDDTPSAAQQTDSLPEDDIASAVLDETVSSFPTFTMLSVRDVKQLIQNSALKSCPLNPMPSTLVSKCEDLLPVLTKIINNSLQSGHFPEIWKEALVFPLLKKPSLVVIFLRTSVLWADWQAMTNEIFFPSKLWLNSFKIVALHCNCTTHFRREAKLLILHETKL